MLIKLEGGTTDWERIDFEGSEGRMEREDHNILVNCTVGVAHEQA